MRTKITGGFWKEYQELVREKVIPYQWKMLNGELPDPSPSYAVRNFKIAAGLEDGEFQGLCYQDSDLGKWLEAAACSLGNFRDEKLEMTVDSVVDILEQAQEQDGYLNTYYILKEGSEKRWTNLRDHHELYCAGHLLEAAVAYYKITKKEKFLNIMIRYVDHMISVFGAGEDQIHGYPGHQEIELALIRLYEITEEKRFLELASYFIDERGKKPNFFKEEAKRRKETDDRYKLTYSQSHIPVREQRTAAGHAVRAVYMYSAMADLARLTCDEALREACVCLWQDVTERQMYVTGGIGADAADEAFTFDYDLPNDLMYHETCASIGLIFWAQRMLLLEHHAKYADVLERALYNGVLSGISLDGERFFYVNPLEVCHEEGCRNEKRHVRQTRQPWFETACCPPNLSRLIASVGDYVLVQDQNTVYVNLYMDAEASLLVRDKKVQVKMSTDYPWDGRICLEILMEDKTDIKVNLRLPYWCERYSCWLDGKIVQPVRKNGYLVIQEISGDTRIDLELSMSPRFVYANSKVRKNNGKVCLQRGPLIYCLEETDNGKNLDSVFIDAADGKLCEFRADEMKEHAVYVRVPGYRFSSGEEELYSFKPPEAENTELLAVPYFMWGNRGQGEMKVWIQQTGYDKWR